MTRRGGVASQSVGESRVGVTTQRKIDCETPLAVRGFGFEDGDLKTKFSVFL